MNKEGWDQVYRIHKLDEIPCYSSQPDKNLVKLVREKRYLYAAFMERKN